jgi:hypothetical protein
VVKRYHEEEASVNAIEFMDQELMKKENIVIELGMHDESSSKEELLHYRLSLMNGFNDEE